MASGSSSKNTSSHGAWLGSEIYDGHIEALHHHRMLSPASLVMVRIPDAETAATPREGEILIFDEQFYRRFGILASTFFSNCLIFFGLQPHHLAPNAILQLSAFVVLCEGFLGIEPRLDLWQSLFFLKQQSRKMDKAELEKLDGPRPMTSCGAALVHHRLKSGFPQMPLQESIRQWQKRILPLQRRPHLVCQMSGRYDPCRTSAKSFIASAVARGVNQISTARMDDGGNWEWGLAPYDRSRLPPMMFEKLEVLNLPAPDVATFDASKIEDEGMIEPRCAASEGSEHALELEGTEPSGEHLKPSIVDWTDDDELHPPYLMQPSRKTPKGRGGHQPASDMRAAP
ncbi:hypothetical protein D1007_49387 [Hordeum vulgare]|nr:hypothetical protein D1007_49387 [Hordeum vulgare]